MKQTLLILTFILGGLIPVKAQITAPSFGKGVQIMGKDSSYFMKIGLRFQTLALAEWSLADEAEGYASDFNSSAMIRRSRMKFDGWAFNPKLKYKLELALSNRDNGGGNSDDFGYAANIILDAVLEFNFYRKFSVKFGQGKLAGNRERVISSGNLQFVDRSRLNSRFNLDRDLFIQLKHHHTFGREFLLRSSVSMALGEGKNQITGDHGGYGYTYRLEFLPFGKFKSKGDYVGSAVKRESKPKLAIGLTYDNNNNSFRERGQLGRFLSDKAEVFTAKDLNSFIADLMFKYQGISIMFEYVDRATSDDDPFVFDDENNQIGTYYTGSAFNIAAGYMFKNNIEIAARLTEVSADTSTDETHYTIGLNKFFVGHKLKIQMDYSIIDRADSQNSNLWRTQVDIHF